jgi:hypothetical protein
VQRLRRQGTHQQGELMNVIQVVLSLLAAEAMIAAPIIAAILR